MVQVASSCGRPRDSGSASSLDVSSLIPVNNVIYDCKIYFSAIAKKSATSSSSVSRRILLVIIYSLVSSCNTYNCQKMPNSKESGHAIDSSSVVIISVVV